MRGWAKTSPESAASTKWSSHQPPAPMFLSDLNNRTRPEPDHIQGSYGQFPGLESVEKNKLFCICKLFIWERNVLRFIWFVR